MSTARSLFTEAIEDHLALKKQNAGLESTMPLARYDVGDPLERYPGGPGRAGTDTVLIAEDLDTVTGAEPALGGSFADVEGAPMPSMFDGPSPEQAMEAATALESAFGDQPFEPLAGMAPMLSLVEDIDEDDETGSQPVVEQPAAAGADVLRFPGGVGPRDEAPVVTEDAEFELPVEEQPLVDPLATQAFTMPTAPAPAAPTNEPTAFDEAPTGEQPVLVIDTDEPLTSSWADEPAAPARERRGRPRSFGLGRKKQDKQQDGDGWFTDGPRDFNWD